MTNLLFIAALLVMILFHLRLRKRRKSVSSEFEKFKVDYDSISQKMSEQSIILQTMTERKSFEDEIRKKEQEFRLLSTSLPIGVFKMDIFNDLTYLNTKFLEILEIPLEENFNIDLFRYIHPEDREQITMIIDENKVRFRDSSEDFRVVTTGGRVKWVHLHLSASVSDEEISYVGILEDITDRKDAEEELRLAKEAAEESTIAKSRFLANMSHEIRTPMNAVIGMTGLLIDTKLEPDQKEYIEIIRSSGETLLSLINDILDFSKIEAGKLDLENIDFNIKNTIEEVGDILASKAHEKGLELPILIAHNIPEFVTGDPTRLRQVLINLTSNAVKFTQKGEVVIKVDIVTSATPDGQLKSDKLAIRFTVSDTGIGIAAQQIPNLFQSFSQISTAITRKYGGTGLGLAISKKLVELMGGDITVESTEGKGSKFEFTVVFDKPKSQTEAMRIVDEPLKGRKILIVDENENNRFVLREQLKFWECVTEEAVDADSAIRKLVAAGDAGLPFHVAIIDFNNERYDVETLAKDIKGNSKILATKLLLLTSMPKKGDAKRMTEFGFEAYLTKPVREKYLHRSLALMMGTPDTQTGEQEELRKPLITKHSINEAERALFKILLVEDNPVNQKVAVRMLKKLGHGCDIANNGQEALEAVQSRQYDIVFMDCQMPVMDGFEATKRIRIYEGQRRHTPIVAMTANVMKGDREKCLDIGMDDYISKPVTLDNIKNIIDKFSDSDISGAALGLVSKSETIPAADAPSVNIAKTLASAEGDREFVAELIRIFISDTEMRLEKLAGLVAEGKNFNAIKIEAHTIKGSCANIGAERMRILAYELENTAVTGMGASMKKMLDAINLEYVLVRKRLDDYLAG